jgi:Transglutaminase-like superfamily
MRILFVLTGPARRFELMLEELGSRGHEVHVAVRSEHVGYEEVVDRVREAHPQITRGGAPVRNDRWVALAEALGLGIDYLRYLSPEYANSPKLRARAERWAPAKLLRVSRWPLVRSRLGTRALARVLRGLEDLIPDSRQVARFVRDQRPALVMISPLLSIPSQAYYVRAARSLGIRSALLVSSWDNLTNKGLIRELPDRVYVWNEDQRREAIELHGVPPERIVVTGAYSFDHWFGWQPSTTAEQFRQRLGLPAGRPIVLYTCSSEFVAPDERPFVKRWLQALRRHGDERLRGAGVLIRPHPGFRDESGRRDPRWSGPLLEAPGVAVWPLEGPFNWDEASRADYFDSIHHSSAVVGLNTSALIEAAILGRPAFAVLDPEYCETQEGTLHFHYLPRRNGGPVTVGRDLEEHFRQLAQSMSGDGQPDRSGRDFVRRFVRPNGLGCPAVPILVDALEAQLDRPAPRPAPARTRRAVAAVALGPLAALANWSAGSSRLVRRVGDVRAGLWAFRAAASARRQLRTGNLGQLRLPQAPAVPPTAERGVSVGLRVSRPTCLIDAVVRQQWHLAQGAPREVVVGVGRPAGELQAHAWLEGDPSCEAEAYEELLRHPAT